MPTKYMVPLRAVLAMAALFVFQTDAVFSKQNRLQQAGWRFRAPDSVRLPNAALAQDPGVRDDGDPGAGGAIDGLIGMEPDFFKEGLSEFMDDDEVEEGLGPRMNLDSCGGCHAQPAIGGSSPFVNPQVAFAHEGIDVLPSFIREDGPVREVRFVRKPDRTPDGGVHALFTIEGRDGAEGCILEKTDFEGEFAKHNAVFRIPTPMFGLGLIEQIPDSAILANQASHANMKTSLGIRGKANHQSISGLTNNNGNDGTIARFGWKAQNKSLLLFAGEAYNVEQGISNELFPTEREETPECQFRTTPNDVTDTTANMLPEGLSGIEKFAFFGRFLAPPVPSADVPGGADSITNGKMLFNKVGCALCHTPMLTTGNNATVAALNNQEVHLYSDLLVHDMGPGLADGVSQGQAGPAEFRTAPLWGLGKRVFFLHDGRTSDLVEAIQAHQSGSRRNHASEANGVINSFNRLSEEQKQDLLNFLRSL